MATSHPIIPPFPADIDPIGFGHWTSGFTDGEGCFILAWLRKPPHHVGTAAFCIAVRDDDLPVIERIRSFWGCGTILPRITAANPQVLFRVRDLDDVVKAVIPHFDRFPLQAKKAKDYAIWRQGAELCYRVKGKGFRHPTARRGRLPNWTAEDKVEFGALHDALRDVRRYQEEPISPRIELRDPAPCDQLMLW